MPAALYFLYMRKAALLPFIVILAVCIGGLLYLYGGDAFHPLFTPPGKQAPAVSYTGANSADIRIVAQGENTAQAIRRVNYRITSADQLASLWQMIYGAEAPALPQVDFGKYDVLAVFDGSHSTSGYGIRVDSIKDADSVRTLSITHLTPGDSCAVATMTTSPFVLVQVTKSPLTLSHTDTAEEQACR